MADNGDKKPDSQEVASPKLDSSSPKSPVESQPTDADTIIESSIQSDTAPVKEENEPIAELADDERQHGNAEPTEAADVDDGGAKKLLSKLGLDVLKDVQSTVVCELEHFRREIIDSDWRDSNVGTLLSRLPNA